METVLESGLVDCLFLDCHCDEEVQRYAELPESMESMESMESDGPPFMAAGIASFYDGRLAFDRAQWRWMHPPPKVLPSLVPESLGVFLI